MSLLTWLFGERNLHEQKAIADESDVELEHKIEEAKEAAERVVVQAKVEKNKADHIIMTAEQVLRSLRRYEERQHR